MATTQYSRVKVATSTTGTGSYTVGSAIAGFRSFSVVSNGIAVSYLAEFGTDYEYGVGTFTSPSTLARTTVIGSSNSNNAVNWSSPPILSLTPNDQDIQSGTSANQLVRLDSNGKILPAVLPTPAASTLGGVKSKTAVANTYLTGIDVDGTPLTGTVPLSSAGTAGIVYSKTATPNQFFNALGTDGVFTSAQPAFTDLTGQVIPAQLPNPSSSTLGGVKSIAPVSHQFVTSIGTDGTPTLAQPSVSDISGFSSITNLGAQATTSGSAKDFTGIPSTAKRIIVLFNQVSLNNANSVVVQIGNGSVETSGYTSISNIISVGAITFSTGFSLYTNGAAYNWNHRMVLENISGNLWLSTHFGGTSANTYIVIGQGTKTTSGVVDRVRVQIVDGSGNATGAVAFDNGSITVTYEI